MLKKSNRLTTKQVLDVLKNGKVLSSPLFILRYIENQPDTRISAVAPVKIAKKAVARNRARRRMYGVVREFLPSIIPGIHAIIFSRNALADSDFESIRNELKGLLVKSRLLSS
ncbi:MAG: ribonuclease P protein component [Patescibacteria group bacterium]